MITNRCMLCPLYNIADPCDFFYCDLAAEEAEQIERDIPVAYAQYLQDLNKGVNPTNGDSKAALHRWRREQEKERKIKRCTEFRSNSEWLTDDCSVFGLGRKSKADALQAAHECEWWHNFTDDLYVVKRWHQDDRKKRRSNSNKRWEEMRIPRGRWNPRWLEKYPQEMYEKVSAPDLPEVEDLNDGFFDEYIEGLSDEERAMRQLDEKEYFMRSECSYDYSISYDDQTELVLLRDRIVMHKDAVAAFVAAFQMLDGMNDEESRSVRKDVEAELKSIGWMK